MEILLEEVSIIKSKIEKLKNQGYIVCSLAIMNALCLNTATS